MCPFCRDRQCKIIERPDVRIACECGRHSWPNAALYAESLRQADLTVVRAVHNWTQSF